MPGLDPHQRRLDREAQQAEAAVPPPLDPPFPFVPTTFDPWFFGIQNDPLPPLGGQQNPGTE